MSGATQQMVPGDTTLVGIAEGVNEAREAILAAMTSDPDRAWRPADLMAAARGDLSDSKVLIAFWNLVNGGELALDEHLTVRRPHSA